MLPSSVLWGLYGANIVVSAFAVRITNMRRSHRLSRILARNVFLISVLLLVYQLLMLMFTYRVPLASKVPVATSVSAPVPAVGDSVVGGPSLSASFINQVLVNAGSPAAGTGQSLYDLSVQYQVDDAYALATFQHESSYGKYGAAYADHSLGNINCTDYPTCDGRFRSYATWAQGYADFYQLIVQVYIAQGRSTIATIIPKYAPSSENDTSAYIQSVRSAIRTFRADQRAE